MKISLSLAGPLLPHVSAASQHRARRRTGVLVPQARRFPACPGPRLQSPRVVYRPRRGSGGWRGQKVISPRLNYASQAVMRLSGGNGWRTGIFVAEGFSAATLPVCLPQRKETCLTFAKLSRLDDYIFLAFIVGSLYLQRYDCFAFSEFSEYCGSKKNKTFSFIFSLHFCYQFPASISTMDHREASFTPCWRTLLTVRQNRQSICKACFIECVCVSGKYDTNNTTMLRSLIPTTW